MGESPPDRRRVWEHAGTRAHRGTLGHRYTVSRVHEAPRAPTCTHLCAHTAHTRTRTPTARLFLGSTKLNDVGLPTPPPPRDTDPPPHSTPNSVPIHARKNRTQRRVPTVVRACFLSTSLVYDSGAKSENSTTAQLAAVFSNRRGLGDRRLSGGFPSQRWHPQSAGRARRRVSEAGCQKSGHPHSATTAALRRAPQPGPGKRWARKLCRKQTLLASVRKNSGAPSPHCAPGLRSPSHSAGAWEDLVHNAPPPLAPQSAGVGSRASFGALGAGLTNGC